jgi:hypothetical protein
MPRGWFRDSKVEVNCDYCHKIIHRKISLVLKRKRHFCNKECLSLGRRASLVCEVCNTPFSRPLSGKKTKRVFCSKSCSNGRKKTKGTNYSSAAALRTAYLKHDLLISYNRCGWDSIPHILQTHHIDGNRSHNTMDNIEVLCPNCHAIEHWGKT